MMDNGTNGDAVAGDRIFTFRTSVNETAAGAVNYRVSAAFRRLLQRSMSPPFSVYIDPFPLPPDPGEAGKLTLEGIDSDGDGLRDDVQRWIVSNYRDSQRTQAALRESANVTQRSLVATDEEARRSLLAEGLSAARCLVFLRGATFANEAVSALGRQVVNTPQRDVAYDAFAQALKPSWFDAPPLSSFGQFCLFDPDEFPN